MQASNCCQNYSLTDVLVLVYITLPYPAIRSKKYIWSTAWIGTRLKTRKITTEVFAVQAQISHTLVLEIYGLDKSSTRVQIAPSIWGIFHKSVEYVKKNDNIINLKMFCTVNFDLFPRSCLGERQSAADTHYTARMMNSHFGEKC